MNNAPARQRASFLWLAMPLSLYLVLAVVLFLERSGINYEPGGPSLRFLGRNEAAVRSGYTEPALESLVLYDSREAEDQPVYQNTVDTLSSMRVRFAAVDVSSGSPVDLQPYQAVVVAFHNMDKMPDMNGLVAWTQGGGRVLFVIRPYITQKVFSIYRKLGIQAFQDRNVLVQGMTFTGDVLPGADGMSLIGGNRFLENHSYPLELSAGTRVYITSSDQYKLPLLWSAPYGRGRFVVFNTNQMSSRMNMGILGAAYGLLRDVSVYPVINSSVFFVDDFPSQVPGGADPRITAEFHRTIEQFYYEIWWPDMRELAARHGLKYTGLLVESFNVQLVPPFEQSASVDDQRYFGRMLLRSGGDIGLQGYNHVPLCLTADGVNQHAGYPAWATQSDAVQATKAMDDFAHNIFAGQTFTVYMPPANILCPEARKWLPVVLPEVRMITGVWSGVGEAPAYIQDFREAPDGIIEFPVVSDGYFLYENNRLAMMNELGLHYVNSYFLHPYEILYDSSDQRTWTAMRGQFEAELNWLDQFAPGLREMTGRDAAMAVQRFARLKVNAGWNGSTYNIHLGNFYDEAYLMLRSTPEPVSIQGGKLTRVSDTLYLLEAAQPDIQILYKAPAP